MIEVLLGCRTEGAPLDSTVLSVGGWLFGQLMSNYLGRLYLNRLSLDILLARVNRLSLR